MKKTKILVLILCFALGFASCGAKVALSKEEALKLADKYVICLLNHDYETVYAGCTEKIQKQVDVPALRQAWELVSETAGGFISRTNITYESSEGMAVISTTAEFENTGIIITTTFDNTGKIRGIWFNYAPDSKYQPVDTELFTEKEVLIGEYEIKGVVTTPDNVEDYPVVVLVQGSGRSDFDETIGANKPFKELAHGLAEQGIASIRINKRLYQKPVLSHNELTIYDEYMDDIYAAIDYVRENISENVYVAGHSLGAMSAPKIALANNLDGVVMMAGTIRGLEDIVLDQNILALEAMDEYSDKEKQQIIKATQDGVNAVKALKEGDTEAVLGIPAQYWLSLRELDTENILKNKLTVPVLVLQGTADFQVYMDKDFEYMKSVLGHKENITFKSYDGLNHLFMPQSLPGVMDVSEYSAENHIPQYVIDDIAQFIKNEK